MASQAALALENARLYAEVQRLAIIDELTGLYNRRGFNELGVRELDRAGRYGSIFTDRKITGDLRVGITAGDQVQDIRLVRGDDF